jgi:PIN domain nuclease of toxin-antitoxin system
MIRYLDTQVVVWLCEAKLQKLTPAAVSAIEDGEPAISPMVLLELQYLYDIHRIVRSPLALAQQLENQIGLEVRDAGFGGIVRTALFETWTRDPFDRVIVAQARTDSAELITSDAKIRENYAKAVW